LIIWHAFDLTLIKICITQAEFAIKRSLA